ncbi:MAG: hypothetical protein OSA98_26200, partial [Rubripirellula sp.]|nr:hypothetical protein [Rubripirellula sp.]
DYETNPIGHDLILVAQDESMNEASIYVGIGLDNAAAIPGPQETPWFQGSLARGVRNARAETGVHS